MLISLSANYQGHWAGNSFHQQWKLLPDSYQVGCNVHVLHWFGQLLIMLSISIGRGLQPRMLYLILELVVGNKGSERGM